jgi:hypothetical protein
VVNWCNRIVCGDGYGRAGLEKPFHRKREPSIGLSFQKVVAEAILFSIMELPTPRLASVNGFALGGAWITPQRPGGFKY